MFGEWVINGLSSSHPYLASARCLVAIPVGSSNTA